MKNTLILRAAALCLLIMTVLWAAETMGCHLFNAPSWLLGAGWVVLAAAGAGTAWLLFHSKRKKNDPQPGLIEQSGLRALEQRIKKTDPLAFSSQLHDLKEQCLRMERKAEQLDTALLSCFGAARISYSHFASIINGAIGVFCENCRRILFGIEMFDAPGYEKLLKNHLEYTDAAIPYQKTFEEIDRDLETNEKILQRFDLLLKEVAALSGPRGDVETLPAMQQLKELTDQIRFYR